MTIRHLPHLLGILLFYQAIQLALQLVSGILNLASVVRPAYRNFYRTRMEHTCERVRCRRAACHQFRLPLIISRVRASRLFQFFRSQFFSISTSQPVIDSLIRAIKQLNRCCLCFILVNIQIILILTLL